MTTEAGVTNGVKAITADEVIRKRQGAVMGKVLELNALISEREQELAALKQERDEHVMEYELWEQYDERNSVKITHTTTTTVEVKSTRRNQEDRVDIEHCLKDIMKEAGRPLQFGDIRNRLDKFGWHWNSYASAHAYITKQLGVVENAGAFGFYQLINPNKQS